MNVQVAMQVAATSLPHLPRRCQRPLWWPMMCPKFWSTWPWLMSLGWRVSWIGITKGLHLRNGVMGYYNKGVTVPRVNSSRLRKILTSERFQNQLRDRCFPKPDMNTSASVAVDPNASSEIPSLFATTGTVGVVDLGASQRWLAANRFLSCCPVCQDWVRAKTRRCQCTWHSGLGITKPWAADMPWSCH